MNAFRSFFRDETAATAVEYSVMLALILLAVIGTIKAFGGAQSSMWGSHYNQLKAHGF
jgi:Flp pilus assembly pilin Flp